jgi:hypothetical protein
MRTSGYERAAADYYVEPRWVVDALLNVEHLQGPCWDPSCGSGNIPTPFAPAACLARDPMFWIVGSEQRG